MQHTVRPQGPFVSPHRRRDVHFTARVAPPLRRCGRARPPKQRARRPVAAAPPCCGRGRPPGGGAAMHPCHRPLYIETRETPKKLHPFCIFSKTFSCRGEMRMKSKRKRTAACRDDWAKADRNRAAVRREGWERAGRKRATPRTEAGQEWVLGPCTPERGGGPAPAPARSGFLPVDTLSPRPPCSFSPAKRAPRNESATA